MFRFHLRSIFSLALFVLLSAGAGAQVPIPSAEFLPVTNGDMATRSVPFLSQADALARRGYIEEEYLISGTAGVYDYVDNASQSPLVSLVQSATPYVTRLIVRRPANSQRFRGAVVFDILNATRGYDSDIVWHYSQDMIMDKGAVYVGITSKTNTVTFLRDKFGKPPYIPRNASRYATLTMTHDGQVWDMLSQTAALLKDDANPDNPLANWNVRRIILAGYSQSAGYVKTYVNSFHNDAILSDGRFAFDGYFEGAGSFASKVPNPPNSNQEFNPGGDPRNRTVLPAPAPVMRFQTETEVNSFFNSKSTRQTEAESPWVRTYEMAGGAHVDDIQKAFEAAQDLEELGLVSPWPACEVQPSTLPVHYAHSALLAKLDNWIRTGREPPPSQLLSLVQNEQGQDVIETDADGNPMGGLRLPQLEVPLGVWSGASPTLWCILNGSYIPFSEAELAERYPYHGDYAWQVWRAVFKAHRDGFLLPRHGIAIYREALYSDIGARRGRGRWNRWGSRSRGAR